MDAQLRGGAAALCAARRVTVLTGAGVSAESGISTFRAPDGLWARFRPEELASIDGFMANPQRVWEWYKYRHAVVERAQPNAAHRALARLAELRELTLVTQNVDGLHQAAGSPGVIELHGNLRRSFCFDCGKPAEAGAVEGMRWGSAADAGPDAEAEAEAEAAETKVAPAPAEVAAAHGETPSRSGGLAASTASIADRGDETPAADASEPAATEPADGVPRCACGGMLRPDVVWFGEPLPQGPLERAFAAARRCELFLSIGTSAVVYPAAQLPVEAATAGATLVEINPEATPVSPLARWTVRLPAGEALPTMVAAVEGEAEA